MARYRKKPVVIEAIQYDGLNLEEIRRYVGSSLVYHIFDAAWKAGACQPVVDMKIKTLEGEMQVGKGDYIIKGVHGEFYPCKPDIFKETYELANIADVVPKSEVERLTINMNAYGLTAKRLAEENESLEIELENMRRNLGDAREGWNVAECEVERLQEALSKAEADVKNYMKVAEYQQSLSIKRYHEIKRLKEDIERLEDINERDVENLRLAKAEVEKIFEKLKIRECSNSVCAWCVHATAYGRRSEECDKPYIDKNGKEQKACYAYAKFESLIDNELAELKKEKQGGKAHEMQSTDQP